MSELAKIYPSEYFIARRLEQDYELHPEIDVTDSSHPVDSQYKPKIMLQDAVIVSIDELRHKLSSRTE